MPSCASGDDVQPEITVIKLHPPFAFVGTDSGHVGVYCLPTATFMFSWLAHDQSVHAFENQSRSKGIVCIGVDSSKLITTGSGDSSLAIWDYQGPCADHAMGAVPASTTTGRLIRRVDYPMGIFLTAVATDDCIVVAGSSDNLVRVWLVASLSDELSAWTPVNSTAQCIVLRAECFDGIRAPWPGISCIVIWQKRWILASAYSALNGEPDIYIWDWQDDKVTEGGVRAPIRIFQPATPSVKCIPTYGTRYQLNTLCAMSFSLLVSAFSIDAAVSKVKYDLLMDVQQGRAQHDEQDAAVMDIDPACCCVVVFSLRNGIEFLRWYKKDDRCVSGDRFRVAVGGFDGTVTLHDFSNKEEGVHIKLKMPMDEIYSYLPSVNAVAIADVWVLAGDDEGNVCLWDFS